MDWLQFGILLVSIWGMFSWIRADIALNRSELGSDRRDLLAQIESSARENRELINAIREDIKDFHGRLCAIESNRKTN